ncbi:MAG: glycosyltransferase family 4 protein [Phycisphaerae bacterium]
MLNHEFPPVGGGASPVTFELCAHLANLGHTVDVVTMHYKDTPRYEQTNGFNIYRTPALRAKPNICYSHELATYLPGAFFKTLKLCRQNRYDVIHCHFIVPGALLAYLISKITKIPFIVTCHGSDVPGHNPDRFVLLHKLIRPFWKLLAAGANRLTAPSSFLKSRINANAGNLTVDVIPNGIDTSGLHSADKTKSILMCSRLFKFKGFQYALKALNQIDCDWQVNIIGEGPFRGELENEAKSVKMPVKFHGWLDNKSAEYKELFERSLIFIFPSEMENFPTVLLEAMAAGMAIITSTAGGCPEVVGDAGVLVEPRNAAAIRQRLEELINSDKRISELMAAAKNRVQMFSWQNIAAKYVQCYESVITKTGGGR